MSREIVLDCIGETCPVPLIKAENTFKKLAVGDILIVQIDHSCAVKNIPEWAKKTGHNVEVQETANGEWEVIIEKMK